MSKKIPTTVSGWLTFDDTRTAYMAASPKQKAEVIRYLGGILALLRAQAISYQTSHWQVRGDDYYGNHLMFERLYGSVGEEIDTLAEKIVGYVGVEGVSLPDQMEKIHMLCGAWGRIECHHRRGIQSETDLQKALKLAYESIKETGLMTLGLDDFLMATASSHESNQYLLQQALAARPKKAARPRKSSIRRKAAIPKKYEHIDFKPPKGVADAAAKGLELRQKASPSNRGGLTSEEAGKQGIGSGVQRAVNLKNRDTISPDTIKQMHGFLSRAEGYSEISEDNKGTPWNDKGYVAWLLWGGDPAKSWVNKILKQMEAADEKEKSRKAYSSNVQEIGGIKTLPQGRWEVVGWSELSDRTKGAVWDVYDLSYGSIGKHIPNRAAFGAKYKYLYLIDIDDDILPDAFIAYKETHAGFKITLGGTDGTRIAKRAMIQKMKDLIRQPGWYAEGSHKVAEILESAGMRPIDDEEVVRKTLRGKDIEWLGAGRYSRQLGTSDISAAKSLYGTPRVAMQVRAKDENEPTDPKLWAKVQALAKGEQASMTHGGKTINGPNDGKGFTVFPSAYANGWASKVYKDLGGGWSKKAAETGDGSEHVGVFAPLPPELASQFPTKEEDSSRPHVTLCYVGPVPDEQDQKALVEAVRDLYADVLGPIKARLSGVDYFRHDNGSVAYAKVAFSKDMGHLKDRLKSLLEDRGLEVHDQHPLAFNPHVTLAYYDDPHAVWEGQAPTGSWTFNEVEVWGLPEVHRFPIGRSLSSAWGPTLREGRGKAKKDVGHGGLDEWFSGHGGAKGKGEDATWGDWVSISPVNKTLPSGKKVEKGEIVGECGISDDPDWKEITKGGEDPLKCMPRQKAYDMPKAERAEKAKAKQKAEQADSSRGKKPTMTPTFDKKEARLQRIQMKREASARLRAAWGECD